MAYIASTKTLVEAFFLTTEITLPIIRSIPPSRTEIWVKINSLNTITPLKIFTSLLTNFLTAALRRMPWSSSYKPCHSNIKTWLSRNTDSFFRERLTISKTKLHCRSSTIGFMLQIRWRMIHLFSMTRFPLKASLTLTLELSRLLILGMRNKTLKLLFLPGPSIPSTNSTFKDGQLETFLRDSASCLPGPNSVCGCEHSFIIKLFLSWVFSTIWEVFVTSKNSMMARHSAITVLISTNSATRELLRR